MKLNKIAVVSILLAAVTLPRAYAQQDNDSLYYARLDSLSNSYTNPTSVPTLTDNDTPLPSNDSLYYAYLDSITNSYSAPAAQPRPSIFGVPVVFKKQQNLYDTIAVPRLALPAPPAKSLNVDDAWLTDAQRKTSFEEYQLNRFVVAHPELVKYNIDSLPEAPKTYVITSKPGQLTLSLEEITIDPAEKKVPVTPIEVKNWIHHFNSALQLSQAYITANWYAGGNSNLTLNANVLWSVNLNPNNHKNLMFWNIIEYKLSMTSAPKDWPRKYTISEDVFKLSTKFGIRATRNNKWFYTAQLQFQTPFLNNYYDDTWDMCAAFLAPGELNLGIGMTYNTESHDKRVKFQFTGAPFSYNLRTNRLPERIDSKLSLGLPNSGDKTWHQFGSSLEAKLEWTIVTQFSWKSRFWFFTDYGNVQGDFENTLNFAFNRFLSTQISVHLRYDNSTMPDPTWRHWQLKEILSFGFNYKF